jgi:hypothetical protein
MHPAAGWLEWSQFRLLRQKGPISVTPQDHGEIRLPTVACRWRAGQPVL